MKTRTLLIILTCLIAGALGKPALANTYVATYFTIPNLNKGLKLVAEAIYDEKAGIVRKAMSASDALPKPLFLPNRRLNESAMGRALILKALSPLISDIRSEYIERAILPSYQSILSLYAKSFGYETLNDIPRNSSTLPTALRLTLAATESLKPYLSSAEHQTELRELIGNLGRALAKEDPSESARDIGQFSDRNSFRVMTDALMQSHRTRGPAMMLISLLEYLKD